MHILGVEMITVVVAGSGGHPGQGARHNSLYESVSMSLFPCTIGVDLDCSLSQADRRHFI